MNVSDRTIVAAALQAREQHVAAQHVYQLKRISELMSVMAELAEQRFVLLGFEAPFMGNPTVFVEPPPDELLDAMNPRQAIGGKFQGEGESASLWFWRRGVRVKWLVARDDESYGGSI